MRKMGTGSGGGIGMNKIVHRPHGKTEPIANKYRPQGVSQYGGMQGSHMTHGGDSNYRGEPKRGGRGYEPPAKPRQRNPLVATTHRRTPWWRSWWWHRMGCAYALKAASRRCSG